MSYSVAHTFSWVFTESTEAQVTQMAHTLGP